MSGLCPTAVTQYISKIPPRQFSQAPHFASGTDVFPLFPTDDFHVKSTLLMLTVGREKKSEFWHSVIYSELVFETLWKLGKAATVSMFTLGRFAKAIKDPYIPNHSGVIWVFPELEFHLLYIRHPTAAFGPGDPLSSFPLCQKAILCFFSASDGASC